MNKTEFKKKLSTLWQGLKDTIPAWQTLTLLIKPSIATTLKDTFMINSIGILVALCYQYAVFPAIELLIGKGSIYNVFTYLHMIAWSIPFGSICLGLNIYYWQKISQDLPEGVKLHRLEETKDPNESLLYFVYRMIHQMSTMASSSLFRMLLIPGLMAQQYMLGKIPWPWIKYPIHIITTSLLNAFYAFEYDWNKAGLTIDKQTYFFETNWIYFLGFGLPLTLITYFIPILYADHIFAILLPVFVILSTQSSIFKTQNEPTIGNPLNKLPYFWFAQITPKLVSCCCQWKMKNKSDTKVPFHLSNTYNPNNAHVSVKSSELKNTLTKTIQDNERIHSQKNTLNIPNELENQYPPIIHSRHTRQKTQLEPIRSHHTHNVTF